MSIRLRRIVPVVALLGAGCASGGGAPGTTDDAAPEAASVEAYSQDVGLATMTDFSRLVPRIFERYQYAIERFDEGAYSFVDTYWKDRPVEEDEAAAGYVAARTRILLRTRLRSRATNETLAVHRITFVAENMVRKEGGDWEFGVMTEGFRDYAGRIALQFESEFRAGIRND